MQPPQWSICAWLITTASMSFGSMPACFSVAISLPVVGPKIFRLPIPVSNSTMPVAGVENEHVLLQHRVLERQEVLGELLVHLLRSGR